MAKAMTIIPSEDEEQAALFDWAARMDALVREGYHCALCCGWDAARDVIQRYLSEEAET